MTIVPQGRMPDRREPVARRVGRGDERKQAAELTRQALIESALDRFGDKGYEAASTREIAAGAGTNIGSIAYHFGGKEGLRRACADHVVGVIRSVASAALDGASEAAGGAAGMAERELSPQAARERLEEAFRRLVRFVLIQPQLRLIVRYMLREIANPSAALDIIYAGVMDPTHRRLCRLWARATGRQAESEAVRLSVFATIGQVFYFRIGQEIVCRRMGWQAYGPDEADRIAGIIVANLRGSLDKDAVSPGRTQEAAR